MLKSKLPPFCLFQTLTFKLLLMKGLPIIWCLAYLARRIQQSIPDSYIFQLSILFLTKKTIKNKHERSHWPKKPAAIAFNKSLRLEALLDCSCYLQAAQTTMCINAELFASSRFTAGRIFIKIQRGTRETSLKITFQSSKYYWERES